MKPTHQDIKRIRETFLVPASTLSIVLFNSRVKVWRMEIGETLISDDYVARLTKMILKRDRLVQKSVTKTPANVSDLDQIIYNSAVALVQAKSLVLSSLSKPSKTH